MPTSFRKKSPRPSQATPLPPPLSRRLITIAEAAHVLAISRPTVYRGIKTGAIPGTRVSGCVRVDLLRLLARIDKNDSRLSRIDPSAQPKKKSASEVATPTV